MSKFNKDSNAYTIGFLAVLALVVALVLGVLSQSLKPLTDANIKLDTRKKILMSCVSDPNTVATKDEGWINNTYENSISGVLIDVKGDTVSDVVPEGSYDFRNEVKNKGEARQIPIYSYTDDKDSTYYIVQMIGMGLWDEINGYLCIGSDWNTIKGVAFDHKGETPGLGAELVKPWFTSQFINKKLFDEEGDYAFKVYKAGKYISGENGVDGMSGATLTTEGVDMMVRATIEMYASKFNPVNL